jgi:hypothetical protein
MPKIIIEALQPEIWKSVSVLCFEMQTAAHHKAAWRSFGIFRYEGVRNVGSTITIHFTNI